jgi:hypothetical protein
MKARDRHRRPRRPCRRSVLAALLILGAAQVAAVKPLPRTFSATTMAAAAPYSGRFICRRCCKARSTRYRCPHCTAPPDDGTADYCSACGIFHEYYYHGIRDDVTHDDDDDDDMTHSSYSADHAVAALGHRQRPNTTTDVEGGACVTGMTESEDEA